MAGMARANNPAALFTARGGASVRYMTEKNTVTFYLPDLLRKRARKGQHNFIGKLGAVLMRAGLKVAYDDDSDAARLRAIVRPGRSLHLMENPATSRGLTLRRTYLYPFWHIEKQGNRWEWPVAQAAFDPATEDTEKAEKFYRFWQKRLFDDAAFQTTRDGFVYVPLQGRLTTRRSFQHCSPINMVEAVLDHDQTRKVVATLHPSRNYTAAEQDALQTLMKRHARLDVRSDGMAQNLKGCDYIVTQNSRAGFMGNFFGKPLILFAKADFHHIALNVADMGVEAAFVAIHEHRPSHAAYLHWFLQKRAINAGRPENEVAQKIGNVLRGHGWPL